MDAKTLSTPLYAAKGWIKLVAILAIIYGAICALTIIGIIVAWLPIWMGVLLLQCAGKVESAYLADDVQALHDALARLRTYFTIMGVLTLIGIVGGVLGAIAGVAGFLAAAGNM